MITLSLSEIMGIFFLTLLPLIVLSAVSRETLARFFFPDAGWVGEATGRPTPSRQEPPAPMLYLVPFKADRLPAELRDTTAKKTYADLLDVIKANGGMCSWIQAEVTQRLNHIGCSTAVPDDGGPQHGQFMLTGEVLTTVRSHELSQIAFKVTLTCGRQTIFSRLYSATARDSQTASMTQAMGLDSFIRPPYAGVSNRQTNRLLTRAMADVMQQLADDLRRVIPYLGRGTEVQYAG